MEDVMWVIANYLHNYWRGEDVGYSGAPYILSPTSMELSRRDVGYSGVPNILSPPLFAF
jgi:hypothetical protein